MSSHLTQLCVYFLTSLRKYIRAHPTRLVYLTDTHCSAELEAPRLISPIIPILTPFPRSLATHLQSLGYLTRPISHPTVPKGLDRVRVCLHAGNTLEEVSGLLSGIISWMESQKGLLSGTPATHSLAKL